MFIPIAKPIIGDLEKKYVLEVMESGIIAQGPVTRKLEEKFEEACEVKHAIAVSSGTTALIAALLAHDIGPGDEVITTPFSFMATATSIIFTGATPVFIDIEEDTYNIDASLIEAAITEKTKAILPVHLYGHPCDMDAIMDIAEKNNLVVIEDSAQALSARYKNRPAGSFGTGCFSLYATKNITSGEGGMITTNSDSVADKCRLIRNHGMKERNKHEMIGYNFRTSDMCAAIGVAQMEKRNDFQEKRTNNAKYLSENLKGVEIPITRSECVHAWHQYTIRISGDQNDAIEKLKSDEVGAAVFYPKPMYDHPCIQEKLSAEYSLSVAEKACREVLQIPVHPLLNESDLERIVSAVCKLN
ncbi:DegT/DnrJ/EryC1/StrS family aminotransferase [Candidatus Peribacteria bacterium]|nr:DegT/DnrJ/EryC1/StrS family aminotransferase [Candidatus Peribacteria bacterium]MBT4021168.1 DegT/DnrJ/EryC1/StrS family aminotransferase [Candidatus Peribacteria bacterium]MBT4240944.1 DegT/DnrJ/EryC1/StrS family aminotransferase [Candidatus Peribacteria bacterium]MBT4474587.1 DegT/DnrJ/EryC1/StrS family aminotransferase [Candidatus Peribacteria bacterium]